ncbi:hypothetical protein I545_6522 [Mycobacterium kansasii 662]|uniref:Uncharacterized protein n=1 Tax=Mycobacterium kansasii 662 TaxID=1299326 RepID=X7YGP0_MYCKA|nr:hypothetical protein I545_6522 [Mycobacterium kansasii 662]
MSTLRPTISGRAHGDPLGLGVRQQLLDPGLVLALKEFGARSSVSVAGLCPGR